MDNTAAHTSSSEYRPPELQRNLIADYVTNVYIMNILHQLNTSNQYHHLPRESTKFKQ